MYSNRVVQSSQICLFHKQNKIFVSINYNIANNSTTISCLFINSTISAAIFNKNDSLQVSTIYSIVSQIISKFSLCTVNLIGSFHSQPKWVMATINPNGFCLVPPCRIPIFKHNNRKNASYLTDYLVFFLSWLHTMILSLICGSNRLLSCTCLP